MTSLKSITGYAVRLGLAAILVAGVQVAVVVAAGDALPQAAAPAQATPIATRFAWGRLSVQADLREGELLSIEVMGPSGNLVIDEDVVSPSFSWAPGPGHGDGLYRYEIQVVDRASDAITGRKAGHFAVRGGQIVVPAGDRSELAPARPESFLWWLAGAIADCVVRPAAAQDVTVSSAVPTITFVDTDSAPAANWANLAPITPLDSWRVMKGGSTVVLDIQADEATYAANLGQSLVVDSAGNLYFANNGMVFDRLNQRLGIGTITPAFKVDAVGGGIRLRNNTSETARTIELRTNLTSSTTDVSALNADLGIRAGTDDAAKDIFMMSRRVGVGSIAPASKLHVVGTTPPQFIVENTAGNARMDFRRSSATGVSQLLFGTGPVATGTLDYQIGMFLDSVFQVRVTSDASRGIALTPAGTVGIGTTTPASKLHVVGLVTATGYASTSDGRLKENVAPISGALGKVMALEGVSFTWKKDGNGERRFPEGTHYGVLAQQVEAIVPPVVRASSDGEKAVAYSELVPVLIEAIKEQQAIIRKLNDRIATMESKVDRAAVMIPVSW